MAIALSEVYITNPGIAFVTKNDTTKIIFLDESMNEIIELVGPAAKCFCMFDKNASNLEDIKSQLGQNIQAQTFDKDFEKLVSFLISKSLIVKL